MILSSEGMGTGYWEGKRSVKGWAKEKISRRGAGKKKKKKDAK
jgi:hypothetical protein